MLKREKDVDCCIMMFVASISMSYVFLSPNAKLDIKERSDLAKSMMPVSTTSDTSCSDRQEIPRWL